jgi:hypothetical protein
MNNQAERASMSARADGIDDAKATFKQWEPVAISHATHKLVAALFDTAFYLETYPDVKQAGVNPIAHYLESGWKEDRNPSPMFNTRAYLEANPDVREAGVCPLVEYVTSGIIKNRPLRPRAGDDTIHMQVAGVFDVAFYLETYPDVVAAGVDPLSHYLEDGWRQNRNPSSAFDTSFYLNANPDVREAGICPLLHYVTHGAAQGRLPRSPGNPARMAINSALPVAERVKPWLRPLSVAPSEGLALQKVFSALLESQTTGIVVSLSHDDYATIFGGVQNCISDEERVLRERGWTYLHLCPAQPLPIMAEPAPAESFFVWVRLNGEQLGAVSVRTLIEEFGRARFSEMRRVFVLHHLMGFCPELVADIAEAFTPHETIVWVHDLFTLCSNFAMLRNNVVFCGGPDPDSPACNICAYGSAERKRHLDRVKSLFDNLNPSVLAPSEAALTFWLGHGRLTHQKAEVIPHGALVMESEWRPVRSANELHLRVGFTGGAAYHKGWHVFEELAARHYKDSRYSFFHLGSGRVNQALNISFVNVTVDPARRHSMVDTLIANQIDVIVNWSLCYETFCFVAYEAVAGGAFVLARKSAGNIVPAVSQEGVEQGLGLDTEQELFDLFESGEIFEIVTRRRYGEFHIQAATALYLERPS